MRGYFGLTVILQITFFLGGCRNASRFSVDTQLQSDFQSEVDKQKNQLTLDLMDQNLALC